MNVGYLFLMQTRLEEYLTLADGLPLDLVEGTEKGREKDRRQVTREEKILQQKEEHVSTLAFASCYANGNLQIDCFTVMEVDYSCGNSACNCNDANARQSI